jgi:flagellin-like protein
MNLSRGVASVISVILMVAVVVVLAATVSVFALQLGEQVSDVGPTSTFHIEYDHLGDGVEKNDTVTITHVAGDVLLRENLEVVIGDDMVYNE